MAVMLAAVALGIAGSARAASPCASSDNAGDCAGLVAFGGTCNTRACFQCGVVLDNQVNHACACTSLAVAPDSVTHMTRTRSLFGRRTRVPGVGQEHKVDER